MQHAFKHPSFAIIDQQRAHVFKPFTDFQHIAVSIRLLMKGQFKVAVQSIIGIKNQQIIRFIIGGFQSFCAIKTEILPLVRKQFARNTFF